jgi:hypothetical protein
VENIVEVEFTVAELRSVVKSLAIGSDQVAKKLERYGSGDKKFRGGDKHYQELCDEYESLTSALAECQSVLSVVLRSKNG